MGTIRDIDLLECPAGFPTTPWDWGNHVVQPDSRASCFGLKRKSKVRGYSHDPGMTFILERVHSISIQESFIYFSVFDYMIPKGHFVPVQVLPEQLSFWYEISLSCITENDLCSGLKLANRIVWSEWRMHIWSGAKTHSRERLRSSRLVFAVKLANFLIFFVSGRFWRVFREKVVSVHFKKFHMRI